MNQPGEPIPDWFWFILWLAWTPFVAGLLVLLAWPAVGVNAGVGIAGVLVWLAIHRLRSRRDVFDVK
jgi:hypothetical protein